MVLRFLQVYIYIITPHKGVWVKIYYKKVCIAIIDMIISGWEDKVELDSSFLINNVEYFKGHLT